ncbi:hypothetical protein [Methanocella arvoryzae]|uniref:hypothetical protein n=1 Tax=Methanocella arvoryzae TaxID=1175445 RepID=UPI001305133E|nr:hypothetical protein [Methanocella arvoryzae]
MSDQIIRNSQCSCEIQFDEVLTHQIRQHLDQNLCQEYIIKLAEEKRKSRSYHG